MFELTVLGSSGVGLLSGSPDLDLGRGAIAGALIAGAAFLAGYAAIKRSGLAFCALLMVLLASALQFSWLGFFPALPENGTVFILGLFAASGIVFLSASIGAARHNPLLGGVMFTGALILAGLGVINFVDRVDAAPLLRFGAIAVGGFAVVLAVMQAVRGDNGARLILPGVALAILAPIVGPLGTLEGASGLVSHSLFTFGILAASLVCLADGFGSSSSRSKSVFAMDEAAASFAGEDIRGDLAHHHGDHRGSERHSPSARERTEVVIDSALGRVLDYSGIAIWDWSEDFIDQTETLPELLGADSQAHFTPDALRQFVHKDDLKTLETEVFAATDGPFDVRLKLFDGRSVRLRGARAATTDEPAQLERVVAFIESDRGEANRKVQDATRAAVVPAGLTTASATPSNDFDIEHVVAAFQPIVSFSDMRIVGHEALARLEGQTETDTPALIRAASHHGKSDALSEKMLTQAAAFLAAERKKNKGTAPDFVAMNVSWSQMRAPAFADAVANAFKTYALPKGALVLELTEGEAVSEAGDAAAVFRKLKGLGARLAFDDFGAGFSCLSNLRKYDFDYIKIDKSFADDLVQNGDGAKIARALTDMGKDLGLDVIIEGIESPQAAKAAASIGCAYGQGFALGKPGRVTRPASSAISLDGKLMADPTAKDETKAKAGAKTNAKEKVSDRVKATAAAESQVPSRKNKDADESDDGEALELTADLAANTPAPEPESSSTARLWRLRR